MDIETSTLRRDELVALIRRVFRPGPEDRRLAILLDLPDALVPDNADWHTRRAIAAGWAAELGAATELGLAVELYFYPNVHGNNGPLPAGAWRAPADRLPQHVDQAQELETVTFAEIFRTTQILLAPTELSATAPLKMAAREFPFRAATLPGFSPLMIPALRLDYLEIDRRVRRLKGLLDRATAADLRFRAAGRIYELRLDLRHRNAHASSGLLHQPGVAGNLPSGEAYIVPYEGELAGEKSLSAGFLPVELDGELLIYRIAENRAVEVVGQGPIARAEATRVVAERAYANLAELGLGVLADFGIKPIGETLLDEKLGLHIAFGRSDHFGGQVGPQHFSSPAAVVHIDRVFLPETQPQVVAEAVDLEIEGQTIALLRDGVYVCGWDS